MKIWLNRENNRPTEKGWIHCTSVNEVVTLLMYNKAENVEELTMALNLGQEKQNGGDGSQLVVWMAENGYWPHGITLRGRPEDFTKVAPVITRHGGYPKKRGQYSWTR